VTNHLGSYFRDQRINLGLSLGDLARRTRYRNVSKGSNKIVRFEREGVITDELLARLADALGIPFPKVEELIEQDRQEYLREWEAWVSEPVPMELVAKIIPAVYVRVKLPGDITTPEQAEEFARAYAKEHGWKCCLALSRRHSVWIGKDGEVEFRTEATPDQPNTPWMRLRASGKGFLWGMRK
jgi:transcriptional regulator with XRE-family HTH domain